MKSAMKIMILSLLPLCSVAPVTALPAQEIAVVPAPAKISAGTGIFSLNPNTRIVAGRGTERVATRLQGWLAPSTGLTLRIVGRGGSNVLQLRLDEELHALGEEGYRLRVDEKRVEIRAPQERGLFYAIQTLRQLLPTPVYRQARVEGGTWRIPAVEIEDYPRFRWRGGHLDVGRHFMPKEFVLKYIDLLAMHKMNVFHFHLTEDQGWRIEIKKYPKLTEVGAWRKDTMLTVRPPTYSGQPHGGFYTQDDLKEIVAFARERFINVVPEIEMPGHSQAAIAAYPELGNTAASLEVGTQWGVIENVFNVEGATIRFLQDVLDEVIAIFPSPFIHIGGDEVPKKQWKESAGAQARMRELGLQSEEELQSWFIRQMDAYLTGRGRRLIGWDEILEGGLAPGAAVMCWRGEQGGIEAARMGHDVVMTPTSHTYFDYYQSSDREKEPRAIGGFLPLDQVYRFEPIPANLGAEESRHIMGAQFQLWTEFVPNPKQAEYMAYPRACALSEAVWSPAANRSFDDFVRRLSVHLERLRIIDVNYRPLDPR